MHHAGPAVSLALRCLPQSEDGHPGRVHHADRVLAPRGPRPAGSPGTGIDGPSRGHSLGRGRQRQPLRPGAPRPLLPDGRTRHHLLGGGGQDSRGAAGHAHPPLRKPHGSPSPNRRHVAGILPVSRPGDRRRGTARAAGRLRPGSECRSPAGHPPGRPPAVRFAKRVRHRRRLPAEHASPRDPPQVPRPRRRCRVRRRENRLGDRRSRPRPPGPDPRHR